MDRCTVVRSCSSESFKIGEYSKRHMLQTLHRFFLSDRAFLSPFRSTTTLSKNTGAIRSNRHHESVVFPETETNTYDYARGGLVIICRIERYLLATCHAPGLCTKPVGNNYREYVLRSSTTDSQFRETELPCE